MSRENTAREPPRGRSKLYKDPLKSIVPIAESHGLDPNLLIEAYIDAWRNDSSLCGDLSIRCRGVNGDSAMFLVTEEGKVVSQFPISLRALRNPELLEDHVQDLFTPPHEDTYERGWIKIGKLRVGMKGIDVKAEVDEIPPRTMVTTRWGGRSYVSNAMISDETGSIRLSLWNSQIDEVNVGDLVEVENGYVSSFAGEPQLRIGRKGRFSVV